MKYKGFTKQEWSTILETKLIIRKELKSEGISYRFVRYAFLKFIGNKKILRI